MIRIVIVEDLPIVREGLKVLIDQIEDFQVTAEFSNGKEFIDALGHLDADIVLTDIDMPVMDGIKATKIAISQYPELRVIALSMYNESRYYYEMLTAGAKGFVSKHSDPAELEMAIREVRKGGNHFSQELLQHVILNMSGIEESLMREKEEILHIAPREKEILRLICKGHTNKELADDLSVSVKTIESSKAHLMKKTNTRNNAGLIIWAIRNKFVDIHQDD